MNLGVTQTLGEAAAQSHASVVGLEALPNGSVSQASVRDGRQLYRAGLAVQAANGAWSLGAGVQGYRSTGATGYSVNFRLGYAW